MKLSEAMRIGASWTGQAFWRMKDAKGNTCAMGSVLATLGHKFTEPYLSGSLAARYRRHKKYIDLLERKFPILSKEYPDCPVRKCPMVSHLNTRLVIQHLNDSHQWTREQIADWIETLEKAEEANIIKQEEINNHAKI